MKDAQVNKDVDLNFTLREYNGSLKSLKIDEVSDFPFASDKTDYTIEKSKDTKNVTLRLQAEIPNAEITVNGQKVNDGACIVDVSGESTIVKIVVNDGIKNTLNDKWAEKEYTLVFNNKAEEVKPDPKPDPEKPEPGQPDPKPEPGQPEPGQPDPKPEPGQPNPGNPNPDKPAPTPDSEKPATPPAGDNTGNAGSTDAGANNQKPADTAAKTGDSTDMETPIALIAICGLGAIALRRRKNI